MNTERSYTTTTELDDNKIQVRRITWGAIFAGALVMLVIMLLLSLLGIGIGLGAINPLENQAFQGLGTGAVIWWIISNLIAVFAGGYVTGRLMNYSYKGGGILHGIVAWSLFTFISFFLLSTAVGTVIGGVGSVVTKSVSSLGSTAGMLVGGSNQGQAENILNLDQIADRVLSDQEGAAQSGNSGQYDIHTLDVLKQIFFDNGQLNTNVQYNEVVNALSQNSNLSQDQARELANEVMSVYQDARVQLEQVKDQAVQTADKATSVASQAAIWSFVALIIGAFMAGWGGYIGRPDELRVTENTRL